MRLLLWFSAALVFAACGTGETAEVDTDQRSFGTIETEPFVTLGAADAREYQRFSGIRGVYRLPDGNTVVAEEGRQLRWFDSAGRPVRRGDAAGGGSPEYRALMWMSGYRGDSLIAYDAASEQLSVLDADGLLARSFRFTTESPPGLTLPGSPFPDGSLLAMAGPSHVQQRADGWWAVLQLVTFTPQGLPGEHLGTALRHPCGRVVERCAAGFSEYRGTWTAGPRGTYIARPDRTEIRLVTGDSTEILNGPPLDWMRGPDGGSPTYSRLLFDSEGNLWAQSGDHSRAAVFDPEGELAGTIQVPSELQIYQVGPDFMVGVIMDQGGGERVQVHELHRHPGM